MKRGYFNTIMFISILLNVILIVFFVSQYSNVFGSKDKISTYYNSFYESVSTLDRTFDQIDDTKEDMQIIEDMYESNIRLNIVYDRLVYLEDNIGKYSKLDLPDIKNKLGLLKFNYYSFMLDQIMDNNKAGSEEFKEYRKEIKDFLENLPEEYSGSKPFVQKFNDAVKSLDIIHPF
ncbi:MAG: hypothetical protein NAG76_17865 [Candidatus Pristimantibacillus lignocellulolyticus]|uniref:Uncharacterized protein n=1 Tax=Candidatus Pristimantibacillus lignocellulolyticus TaxID=2994561 RepID=A0A9J6ZC59_9BACL|nr:MAG: hypothetical protein NAG76_17865 [Candidatus Pristimantibacillus lignocellulolyticus]